MQMLLSGGKEKYHKLYSTTVDPVVSPMQKAAITQSDKSSAALKYAP